MEKIEGDEGHRVHLRAYDRVDRVHTETFLNAIERRPTGIVERDDLTVKHHVVTFERSFERRKPG